MLKQIDSTGERMMISIMKLSHSVWICIVVTVLLMLSALNTRAASIIFSEEDNVSTYTHVLTIRSPNIQENGDFGCSVSSVPDVSGDGIDDIVVGAQRDDLTTATENAGTVYVFDGVTWELINTIRHPEILDNVQFGRLVLGIPDINGDGKGDVLIGNRFDDKGIDQSCGSAYAYDGATGDLLFELLSPHRQFDGAFGNALAALDDLTGDDVPELLVAAEYEEVQTDEGLLRMAYIFDGATGKLFRTLHPPNPDAYMHFGYSVSSIPDINDDGVGDIIIGHLYERKYEIPASPGKVYAYCGATGNVIYTLNSPNKEKYGGFGHHVAAIPDIDGDGCLEIVAQSNREYYPGSIKRPGTVHVFSGKSGKHLRTFYSPNPVQYGDYGVVVRSIGDCNGDGIGELIIGSPRDNLPGNSSSSGCAYLYDGATAELLLTITSPIPLRYGNLGESVALLHNTRGPGTLDIVMGEGGDNEAEEGVPGAGRVHVFQLDHVALPTPLPTPDPTPTPTYFPTPFPDADGDGKWDMCETEDLALLQKYMSGWTNTQIADSDGDGLTDAQEDPGACAVAGDRVLALTNPRLFDTDDDGYSDGLELLIYGTDPLDISDPPYPVSYYGDRDGDGLLAFLDPDDSNADMDEDGFMDGYEAVVGSDYKDPLSIPSLGDADGDGTVNNLDAIRLFNFILMNVTDLEGLTQCDVRCDGYINNLDALVLFHWTMGNIRLIPYRPK